MTTSILALAWLTAASFPVDKRRVQTMLAILSILALKELSRIASKQ